MFLALAFTNSMNDARSMIFNNNKDHIKWRRANAVAPWGAFICWLLFVKSVDFFSVISFNTLLVDIVYVRIGFIFYAPMRCILTDY